MKFKITLEFFQDKKPNEDTNPLNVNQENNKLLYNMIKKEDMSDNFKYEFIRLVADSEPAFSDARKNQQEKFLIEKEKIFKNLGNLEILEKEEEKNKNLATVGVNNVKMKGGDNEDNLLSLFIQSLERLFAQWFEYVPLQEKIDFLRDIYKKIDEIHLQDKSRSFLKSIFYGLVLEISSSKKDEKGNYQIPAVDISLAKQIIGG